MNWKKAAPWNWFKDEQDTPSSSGLAPAGSRASLDPFALWRGEMERLFDDSFRRALPGAGKPMAGLLRPDVDISEGKKAYTVRADLPGVEPSDLSVEVDGQTLTIRAEKRRESEEEDEGYHCVERSFGSVRRVLSLPDDADPEAIEAKFKHGSLKLRIPKHAAKAQTGRNIEIQSG